MIPLAASPGRLAENVMHFGRVLRHAGMPVGTDRVMTALQALQVAGLESRADFHAVLTPAWSTAPSTASCSTRLSTFSGATPTSRAACAPCCCPR
jgi:uncharacterized protein with von Willebrand factor type A (vWA) domain